jgi:hypothetical protein
MKLENLMNFLFTCEQQFRNKALTFEDDEIQVNYAISYLDGAAQEMFQNELYNHNPDAPPLWLDNWEEFKVHIHLMFGIPNAAGQAEDELAALRMDKNKRFPEFLVKFN